MSFHLTRKAKEDLLQIYFDGVESFGVHEAEKYQDKIDNSIAIIGDNPEIAHLRTEGMPPVRIHPVGVHIIIYHLDDSGVPVILRVRSARENWVENPAGLA